jgi:hypothetical protein
VSGHGDVVIVTTSYRNYTISTRDVDAVEVEQSKRVLEKMNYDRRFKLKIV